VFSPLGKTKINSKSPDAQRDIRRDFRHLHPAVELAIKEKKRREKGEAHN